MKLKDLTMKEVNYLVNEAVCVYEHSHSNDIAKSMLKMGVGEKFSTELCEPSFAVTSVDFIPNEDYECADGVEVYGARGTYSSGRVFGPVSFVLVWKEKVSRFFLKEIVFPLHPFAETDKKIIFVKK